MEKEAKTCRICGKPIPDQETYCPKCFEKVVDDLTGRKEEKRSKHKFTLTMIILTTLALGIFTVMLIIDPVGTIGEIVGEFLVEIIVITIIAPLGMLFPRLFKCVDTVLEVIVEAVIITIFVILGAIVAFGLIF